jgi:hypothetical protein
VKRCASCGREIAESATVCDLCERWADGIAVPPATAPSVTELSFFPEEEPLLSAEPVVAAPPLPTPIDLPEPVITQAAVPEPATLPSSTPLPSPPLPAAQPPARSTLSRRELVIIALALVVGGGLTFTLLSSRGGASTTLAAANPTPAKAAPAPAPRRPAAPPATQKWSTARRAYWTANQHHSDAFELPAENTVAIWMNYVRPILVVRCMGKKTEAFVYTGSALKIEPNSEDHTVSFRFDDETGRSERWPDSAEHDALFAPDAVGFAHRIMSARSLRFGYTPHNAEPVEAQFRTDGLAELISPVAKDCGWQK